MQTRGIAINGWNRLARRFVWVAAAFVALVGGVYAADDVAAGSGGAGKESIPPLAGEWHDLFNGKDLAGWQIVIKGEPNGEDSKKVFQVKDGEIHAYADADNATTMPAGFIVTEKEYGNYDVSLEYKWGEKRFSKRVKAKRDSGLLYHVAEPFEKLAVWPPSMECQIQERDTGDIFSVKTKAIGYAAGDEGKTSRTYELGGKSTEFGGIRSNGGQLPDSRFWHNHMAEKEGWNTVEVRVRGDKGVHIVNGIQNNAWENLRRQNPDKPGEWIPVTTGKLLLQAEWAEVYFRNVKIREAAK